MFALKLLSHTPYRHVTLVAFSLDDPLPEVSTDLPIEVRRLHPGELDDWARFRGVSPDEARSRAESGHECFALLHQGQIMSTTWMVAQRAWLDEVDGYLHLEPGDVYFYDSYTPPEVRGRRLATLRAVEIARLLRAEGYRRIVGSIRPENPVGRRAAMRAGYRPIGVIGCLRIASGRLRFELLDGKHRRLTRNRAPARRTRRPPLKVLGGGAADATVAVNTNSKQPLQAAT